MSMIEKRLGMRSPTVSNENIPDGILINECEDCELQLYELETSTENSPVRADQAISNIEENHPINTQRQIHGFNRRHTPLGINKRKCKINKVTGKRWVWKDFMVECLIRCLLEYKTTKTNQGFDFESNLIHMYSSVRRLMAVPYPDDFGPSHIENIQTNGMTAEQLLFHKRKNDILEKQKKDGYNRVKAKVKELRQGYKSSVDSGRRSDSGRLICNNFDTLSLIWGGSPSLNNLPRNISSSIEGERQGDFVGENELKMTVQPEKSEENICDVEEENEDDSKQPTMLRKKVTTAKDRRSKIQNKLTFHQRDMMMLDLTREELKLKRKSIENMEKSMQATQECMKELATSVAAVGLDIRAGLALLAEALQNQCHYQQMPVHHYHIPSQQFSTPNQWNVYHTSQHSPHHPISTTTQCNIHHPQQTLPIKK